MKSKKYKKQPPIKKQSSESAPKADSFEKLMRASGVIPLEPTPPDKPTSQPITDDTEPIDFDNSFDWQEELKIGSIAEKFTGKEKSKSRKRNRSFKITREFSPDDILDLHGETKASALSMVQNSIRGSRRGNNRALLIITGKGINSKERGGVLGRAVWEWLKHYQLEHRITFQWAPPFLGGKGAILVFF